MITIDPELINNCKKENPLAQQQLYGKCHGWMMGICSRYILNELDRRSMVNDAFYKVFKNIHNYDHDIPFYLWTRRILINCIIDNFRRTKHHKQNTVYLEEDLLARHSGIDQDIFIKYDAEYLIKIINELPPATRTVFNLFAIDGYSHEDISQMLNMNKGTSKWHVSSARKTLIEALSKGTQNGQSDGALKGTGSNKNVNISKKGNTTDIPKANSAPATSGNTDTLQITIKNITL